MGRRKREKLWAVQCPIKRSDGTECGTPIQRTEGGTLDDGVSAHCELVHHYGLGATQEVIELIGRRVDKATSTT